MNNFWNKIKYFTINRFHTKTPAINRSHYEGVYSEVFRTLHNWAVINPETIEISRSNGALFSVKQIEPKGYVYPCIIYKSTITSGSVLITATLNNSDEVFYNFILKTKDKELGFKIVGDKIYVINELKPKSFKLYKPTETHTFEIDMRPDLEMIYWRVDGATIYEQDCQSYIPKRLILSMPTIHTKMSTKKLPISFRVKSVDFLLHIPYKHNKK